MSKWTVNQPTASLGASTPVHLITINPDGTEYHEIIDAEFNEKRRRNDIGKGTNFQKLTLTARIRNFVIVNPTLRLDQHPPLP
jgi:hypothetical protein